MVSGCLESNKKQVTLKFGETNESNGLDSVKVLSVASVKSSFSWGFSAYTRFESPFSLLDFVSSLKVISCIEISGVEEVTLALS